MLAPVLNALFGCPHLKTTFPMTPPRGAARPAVAKHHGTYVVCLKCGQEFDYDWKEMRRGEPVTSWTLPSALDLVLRLVKRPG